MITNIRCMIIDDDELDRLVLHHHLKQYENIEIVATFNSAEKAIPYLDLPIDLLLLDIDLPGMSGIEFRKLAHKIPACIFVSSHPEYAIETFELDTLDFIPKPLKTDRFHHSMQRLFDFFETKEKCDCFDALIGENCIKIKEGGNIYQVKITDILYLEALKDYTRIVTQEKKHCILDSLGNILHKSHFDSFVRIHRSYAVPRHLIRSKNNHEVELVEHIKLPIGRAYKSNLSFFEP
ncbi:LytTR family DNA-binding domain-containing protein [Chryseobacterium daecheongense]|uniref:LytR/AlgR family response regulator transcription factor n=1 Tax=Chryseobacterium daecheongense TaxID=192389 RepID=UPI001FD67EB7|nr:LytTR family DNA-binding domain-containing protein [Chryseobacterium daecheongense]UOU99232.1 LytTR family DNA-binding domain-containing protein [Chryseobacterium daecheongense]